MPLTDYRRKRDFQRTPEPKGAPVHQSGHSFVIQKHDASRLHYDFRLELDGVLKSWAVPKGPSLDPTVKRLAVEVEDHPVDYGDFEGVIPQGEYGGGTVLLWDTGTWEPVGDPHDGLRDGKLKFQLYGRKLQGGWMLVRSRSPAHASKPQWLLFKENDDEARPSSEGDVLVDLPLSVATRRDLDAIASAKDRVWSAMTSAGARTAARQKPSAGRTLAAKRKVANSSTGKLMKRAKKSSKISTDLDGARKEPLPTAIEPQLATLTRTAPAGDEWLHEIKFDGYRMLCRIDGNRVQFISRNQQNWTPRLKPLVEAARQLTARQALLDGEIVVLRENGASDFQALQNAFRDGRVNELQYFVFDLLHLDGYGLKDCPLIARKNKLAELLAAAGGQNSIRYSEHLDGQGPKFVQEACRQHLEGIISKRRDRPYRTGRGDDWLKTKCVKHEEFVIGGFTDPGGSRRGFGALLVGYYDARGRLMYAGKVGTGFDDRTLAELSKRLRSLEQKKPAFAAASPLAAVRRSHWVKPTLVAQIGYSNRTRDGLLRHASYQGLREDKPAHEVTLDSPVPVTRAVVESKRGDLPAGEKSTPSAGFADEPYDARRQTFHGVRLTSPKKVLYPESGITKQDLAAYYRDAADWMLPHLRHRPLVLVRCPDGVRASDGQGKACFYQKHPGIGTPEQLRQLPIREKRKTEPYVLVDDDSGLIALAQIAALEVHAWGACEDRLDRPDRLTFDLDPAPEVPWKQVVASARQLRQFLQELELESFVKTTGGKGLHLVVPIERRHDWADAKAFCRQVATAVASVAPHQYTANMAKAARTNRIFIDYLRNDRGATAIVPYSPRARPGASISTPLTWRELTTRVTSDKYTIENIRRRLASLTKDPWEGIAEQHQSLTEPLRRIRSLSK